MNSVTGAKCTLKKLQYKFNNIENSCRNLNGATKHFLKWWSTLSLFLCNYYIHVNIYLQHTSGIMASMKHWNSLKVNRLLNNNHIMPSIKALHIVKSWSQTLSIVIMLLTSKQSKLHVSQIQKSANTQVGWYETTAANISGTQANIISPFWHISCYSLFCSCPAQFSTLTVSFKWDLVNKTCCLSITSWKYMYGIKEDKIMWKIMVRQTSSFGVK